MPDLTKTGAAAPAAKKRGMKKETREALVAYSFIAPNFIGFCVFTLVPVVAALVLAFMEWDGVHAAKFVGIDNFVRMASDPNFKAAFWHTIEYVIGTVPTTIASLVAVAAVWNMLFNPSMGPVNQLLASFGVENLPKWAAGNDTAMLTVIMFSVWKNMGYYMVIFLAGLQGTNPELYEAASLDGANKWQQFWNVTLPQLAPTTFFVTIMVVIQSFKVYNEVYMITQGGPGTSTLVLVYQIYNEAFIGTPEYGYSCALSMVLFLLVLAVTIIQFRAGEDKDAPAKKKHVRKAA